MLLSRNTRLLFIGDSITDCGRRRPVGDGVGPRDLGDGYVSPIQAADFSASPDYGLQILNTGVSGDTVHELRARWTPDVLSLRPDWLSIFIGINDVWHYQLGIGGTPKDRYEQGLRELVSAIHASGARVLLCTPTVVGEKAPGTNPLDEELDAYAEITRGVARSKGADLCDLRTAVQAEIRARNPDNADKGILTRDGVHLNAAGNRFVADQILSCLASHRFPVPKNSMTPASSADRRLIGIMIALPLRTVHPLADELAALSLVDRKLLPAAS